MNATTIAEVTWKKYLNNCDGEKIQTFNSLQKHIIIKEKKKEGKKTEPNKNLRKKKKTDSANDILCNFH